mmetsp:Transcript_36641/g.91240  ORF Transcript_36641/g.91240 Transcript_36641/m.91240 type:complete len:404 (+) Transcript_36641:10-1221(+)
MRCQLRLTSPLPLQTLQPAARYFPRRLFAVAMSVSVSATSSSASLTAYNNLKALLREANALSEVEGILSYDEQCFMPPGAAAARAQQKAALAKVLHRARTGDEMREAINSARACADELVDPKMKANVRDAIQDFDKASRKSAEIAEAEARLESEAFAAWKEARDSSDFSLFADKLSALFQLKKQVAALTRPAAVEPYDGALDAFERGMTAQRLDEIFAELRTGLLPLLEAILEKKRAHPNIDIPHPALASGPQWTVSEQATLSKEVAAALGYSFDKGRFDVSTHPFTGGAGPTDVRVTSRFSENWVEDLGLRSTRQDTHFTSREGMYRRRPAGYPSHSPFRWEFTNLRVCCGNAWSCSRARSGSGPHLCFTTGFHSQKTRLLMTSIECTIESNPASFVWTLMR